METASDVFTQFNDRNMTDSIKDEKRGIRAQMKLLRERLDPCQHQFHSAAIAGRLTALPEWAAAETVHIYVSAVNNEVDTCNLIQTMIDGGKRVIVPKCMRPSRRLRHIHLQSLDELRECDWGLMEPDHNPEREVPADELDLIITPLLAFDRMGGRLGFGGGYYDTLFRETSCTRIGLAFSFQEIDHVPMETHDCRLHMIVTETETIRVRDV